jgi:WD40 repeat protein
MNPLDVGLKAVLEGHKDAVYALAAGPEGEGFFSAGGDGMVVLWNIETGDGALVARLPATVYTLLYIEAKKRLYAGLRNGEVYEIDMQERRQTGHVKLKSSVFALEYYNGQIVAGTISGELYSLENFPEIKLQKSVSNRSCRSMAVQNGGGWLATGWSDHCIRIFDKDLNEVFQPGNHANSVFALAFSEDGRKLYSGGRDAHLKEWDAENNFPLLQSVPAHWYTINSIVAIKDKLFTGSRDKTIRIWNREPLKPEVTISRPEYNTHSHSVNKLLWLEKGHLLVSAGDDRIIRVWNIGNN